MAGAALFAALLVAVSPGRAATGTPSFAFGRTGGNIVPFTVAIRADGSLATSGPVRLADRSAQLSGAQLAALVRVAEAQRFWSLRRVTICRGTLPDFAALFVTVRTASRTRTVRVRGDCSPRFNRTYRALAQAAHLRS